jgi:hypothetical protein
LSFHRPSANGREDGVKFRKEEESKLWIFSLKAIRRVGTLEGGKRESEKNRQEVREYLSAL